MQGDKLIINGVKYTMNNFGELPTTLTAYKAAEKSNDTHIVFHGELSSDSNFHPSQFMVNRVNFVSAEHYIQYEKALLFGDSMTANQILKSETPLDVKRLSYNISDFNRTRWINKGYELCAKGVREKFLQNRPLLEMLKTTSPKILAEASSDELWGTVIQLSDNKANAKNSTRNQ